MEQDFCYRNVECGCCLCIMLILFTNLLIMLPHLTSCNKRHRVFAKMCPCVMFVFISACVVNLYSFLFCWMHYTHPLWRWLWLWYQIFLLGNKEPFHSFIHLFVHSFIYSFFLSFFAYFKSSFWNDEIYYPISMKPFTMSIVYFSFRYVLPSTKNNLWIMWFVGVYMLSMLFLTEFSNCSVLTKPAGEWVFISNHCETNSELRHSHQIMESIFNPREMNVSLSFIIYGMINRTWSWMVNRIERKT